MTIENREILSRDQEGYLVECGTCKNKGNEEELFSSPTTDFVTMTLADLNARTHEFYYPHHQIILYSFKALPK